MRKGYLSLLLALAFTSQVFAKPQHDNYPAQNDVLGKWMYTYYPSWVPGQAPAGGELNEQFYIGRVRPLKRFTNKATQVIQDGDDNVTRRMKRGLLFWVPIGENDNGNWTSLPSFSFDGEAFSSWSYITTYGNWTQGFLRQPGAFADACHKNGVNTACVSAAPWAVGLSSGDKGHGQNYKALIDGGADKLMKLFAYYGIDGLGFNSEQTWGNVYSGMKSLIFDCHRLKNTYGMKNRLHFDFYNLNNTLSMSSGGSGSTEFSDMFPAANGFFLNYGWDASMLQSSAANAATRVQSAGAGFEDINSFSVYAGMDQQGRKIAGWNALNNSDISIGIWGAHNKNMIYQGSTDDGSAHKAIQNCYLRKCEQFFTGGTRNPVNDLIIKDVLNTGSATFHGVAKLMAAKSALSWRENGYFPFISYMNLGVGEYFNEQGMPLSSSPWYNIGMQDHLPTWRWWITTSWMGRSIAEVPTDTHAGFTFDDAWFGGSCLKVSFDNTEAITATDRYIHLYKTQFNVESSDNVKVRLRYKVLKGKADIYYAFCKEGDETQEIALQVVRNAKDSTSWLVKELNLPQSLKGATTAMIALKFKNVNPGTEILIGEVAMVKTGITYNPVVPTINDAAKYTDVLKTTYRGIDIRAVWNCDNTTSTGTGGTTPMVETATRAATMHCTYTGNSKHASRHLRKVTITGNGGCNFTSPNLQTAVGQSVYFDKRDDSNRIEAKQGETISVNFDFNGEWMHGYVYIDYNNNGTYETNEAVAYSFYNPDYNPGDSGPDTGVNSNGTTLEGAARNVVNPPSFRLPSDLALGTYTLRVKVDWCNLDPCGSDYTADNGGCIADFVLHVGADTQGALVEKWTPVYNDQVDTWYYELWMQQEGKEPQFVTTTTSWAAYGVEVPFDITDGATRQVKIGVRAVAPDGVTKSDFAWSSLKDANTLTILDDVRISKPVIKPGEEFSVSFEDPNHAAANWVVRNSATQAQVKSENGVTTLTFPNGLPDVGSYDVSINGVNTPGLIQISPEATGAMPVINTLTADTSQILGGNKESVTLSYTSRNADGTVSQGLRVQDPYAFVARINDPSDEAQAKATEFAMRAPYTYCMWFKAEAYIHSSQGINLLYKSDLCCDWPQQNWGEFWVQIRPEGAGKIPSGSCLAEELSFNVTGWSAHDNATAGMTNGESLKKNVWYHLAVSLSWDNTLTMHINGRQVARLLNETSVYDHGCQSGYNTNSAAFKRATTRLYVGASSVYKAGFNGVIDDVQCWDKVLTTEEIQRAMRGYKTAEVPENLKGYWTFDTTEVRNIDNVERTVYPNQGKGTKEAFGYYGTTPPINSDGNTTLSSLNETFVDPLAAAGCPILEGSFPITTAPVWSYTGGDATFSGKTHTATKGSASMTNALEAAPCQVKLVLENGWGVSEPKTVDVVVVDWTVGLEAAPVAEGFKVYPNPFVERVSMLFNQAGEYTFQVVNLEGKVVNSSSKAINAGEVLDMQVNGEKGMYILQIRNKENKLIQSVKIEKQ